jgi:predicted transcriptional regulator
MHNDNRSDKTAPEELDWPETLRITISTPKEAADRAIAAASAVEQGDRTPAEISFGTVGKLRRLLTDRRVEIVRSLMDEPAESISALAERLDRSYSVVHDDVDVLADYGIVQFRSDSRDRAPFVPYDSVEIDVTIQGARSTDVEASG